MTKRISAIVFIPVVSLILFCLVFGIIFAAFIGPIVFVPMLFVGLPLLVIVAAMLQLLDDAIKEKQARRVSGSQHES